MLAYYNDFLEVFGVMLLGYRVTSDWGRHRQAPAGPMPPVGSHKTGDSSLTCVSTSRLGTRYGWKMGLPNFNFLAATSHSLTFLRPLLPNLQNRLFAKGKNVKKERKEIQEWNMRKPLETRSGIKGSPRVRELPPWGSFSDCKGAAAEGCSCISRRWFLLLVSKCLPPSLICPNQSPLGLWPLPASPHHLWLREPPCATGSLWATHTVHRMFRPWWWAAVLHLICWSLQMTSFLATSFFLWIISDLSKSVFPRSVTPPSSTTPSITKGTNMCQGLPVSPFFLLVKLVHIYYGIFQNHEQSKL